MFVCKKNKRPNALEDNSTLKAFMSTVFFELSFPGEKLCESILRKRFVKIIALYHITA